VARLLNVSIPVVSDTLNGSLSRNSEIRLIISNVSTSLLNSSFINFSTACFTVLVRLYTGLNGQYRYDTKSALKATYVVVR
jgi:hypothetical protein